MTLKELIRLRRQLKVPLLELAASAGLVQNYLQQIEDEIIQPTGNDLKRIEKALLKIQADPDRQADLEELGREQAREIAEDPDLDLDDIGESDIEK